MANTKHGQVAGSIVLFLDIDGVLLPFPDAPDEIGEGRLFPNEPLAALSKILIAFQEGSVELVLSSTWRVKDSNRQDILNDFQAYGHGPLAQMKGDFSYITDPTFHGERQHEIHRWLRTMSHLEIAAWVALDDEELLEGSANAAYRKHFEGRVVHCNSRVGLTEEQADEAVVLIRKQLVQQN